MKAFRHTGIEGGYGSLQTQNWLLGLRRSQQSMSRLTSEQPAKWYSRQKNEPDAKVIVSPFPKGTHTTPLKALLLQYEKSDGKFGGRAMTATLLKARLIRQIKKPTRSGSDMDFGDEYQITKAGRDYLQSLKAPCVKEQAAIHSAS
jgi:hypothetical protein